MPTNTPAALVNDIRDIKPPLEISDGVAWWVWALAAVAVLAGLFLYFFLRRRTVPPAPPAVPPHTRALLRLKEALNQIGQPEPFCVLVSSTIRIYLEERFNFRAPERTTEEFLRELQETNLLAGGQKSSLGRFLESCDLVKFARYEPAASELQDLHQSAVKLVEETTSPENDGIQDPSSSTTS